MTYLELCQELVREAGISGSMSTVIGQSGEMGRAANWIRKAYRLIQNKHSDWEFLRRDVLAAAAAGKATYLPTEAGVAAAEFGAWRFTSGWRCYSTAAGVADEQKLDFVPYDRFRNAYIYGNTRAMTGRPTVITEAPDGSLIVWPVPDAGYMLVGEQYRAPATLTADGDVPIFAAQLHDVIVYRAMMLYGEYEGDPSTFQTGQTECARILSEMESRYLPEWENAGAMA